MTTDACLPPACSPPSTEARELPGLTYRSTLWSPGDAEELVAVLAGTGEALAEISTEEVLGAWGETVGAFLDSRSAERSSLDPALALSCGLSGAGMNAGLEAVLGGVRREAATRLSREAPKPRPRGLLLVILASNLPALAVQSLLPALLLRRPVIVKSPTAEPFFAPAFVRALRRRLPALAPALAAITWRGGDAAVEAPFLAAAEKIVAYGEDHSLDEISRRAAGTVVRYGPKVSCAILGTDASVDGSASGLARDVALFDQRGCLSVHSVYTAGDPETLAARLANELEHLAHEWPPGPIEPAAAAGVQQLRGDAEIRGLTCHRLAVGAGTVVVEPQARFQPSPGLRAVRVHPLTDLDSIPAILAPWSGRLQGVAVAGSEGADLTPELQKLGVSRISPPGELQTPDALWHNGGTHPLSRLV